MTAAGKLPPLMTVDEFLDWDDGTDTRYELVDGVLRAMAPSTHVHGIIQANFISALHTHLRASGMPCHVVAAPGIKPLMRADWNFRIPDIGVTCERDKKGERIVAEPILLIEILSPSNAADTYENIRAYATLPSIAELVVVHSTRMEVELLRKGAGSVWPANATVFGAGKAVELSSVAMTLAVDEIYAGTHLVG